MTKFEIWPANIPNPTNRHLFGYWSGSLFAQVLLLENKVQYFHFWPLLTTSSNLFLHLQLPTPRSVSILPLFHFVSSHSTPRNILFSLTHSQDEMQVLEHPALGSLQLHLTSNRLGHISFRFKFETWIRSFQLFWFFGRKQTGCNLWY